MRKSVMAEERPKNNKRGIKQIKKVPRKRSNPKVVDPKTMSLRMAKRTWKARPKGRPPKAAKQKLAVAKQVLKTHGYVIKRGDLVKKSEINKGRGRPKKLKKPTKPVRGRGRPRTKPAVDKPKKARGRPRKNPASAAPSRGRGRPPKPGVKSKRARKTDDELLPKILRRKRLPPKKKR